MNKYFIITVRVVICAASLLILISCGQSPGSKDKISLLRDGDIVFQDFPSSQSTAVKAATGSRFSHCGIIFFRGKEPWVWEAVQPVKMTSIRMWIDRNEKGEFYIKRLKNAEKLLNKSTITRMMRIARGLMNKDYDIYFGWSDERMYCSEYVWKIYNRALAIQLGSLKKLGEYNLDHPEVRSIMAERYGDDIPYDEPVISPQDIWESSLLETIE